MIDRPNFDMVFGQMLNDPHTQKGGGPWTGRIRARNPITHRVSVYLPEFDQTLNNVRVRTTWHGGSGSGFHMLPLVGAEVKVQANFNKGSGFTNAEVVGTVFSDDFKPPQHPAMQGEENYYAFQGRVGSGTAGVPGNVLLELEDGSTHRLQMGKVTQQGQGAADSRDKGLNITQPENHALRASNGLAMASQMAARLPTTVTGPQDLAQIAAGMDMTNRMLTNSIRASGNAAMSMGQSVATQVDARAISNGAENIAQGLAPTGVL